MKNLSRSVRRHHRVRMKLRVLNWRFIGERPDPPWLPAYLAVRWRYDRRWYAEEPLEWMSEGGHKHWRHAMMTGPSRAKEHQALRLLLRGLPENAAIRRWPDHKKPFVYYW